MNLISDFKQEKKEEILHKISNRKNELTKQMLAHPEAEERIFAEVETLMDVLRSIID